MASSPAAWPSELLTLRKSSRSILNAANCSVGPRSPSIQARSSSQYLWSSRTRNGSRSRQCASKGYRLLRRSHRLIDQIIGSLSSSWRSNAARSIATNWTDVISEADLIPLGRKNCVAAAKTLTRSEEHTSELQSLRHL